MRKLAGATTPCQSNAAATRLTRSPPAAKKLATTSMTTSARNAIGSRNAKRGDGQPALSLRADDQRAFDMRAPKRLRNRIGRLAASSSAIAVAGRCASPLPRSSRRKPSSMLGTRTRTSGSGRQRGNDRRKRIDTIARASGGNAIHSPAQENARNRPSAVASDASAGHSRSHSRPPRARLSAPRQQSFRRMRSCAARPSCPNAAPSPGLCENLNCHTAITQANPRPRTRTMRSKPGRHAIERNQLVNFKAGAHQRPFARPSPALPAPAARVL